MKTALVIGAGPAGLMAAEVLSQAGLSVTIADQMPSPARKFLMAGKSGLNLTKAEPLSEFIAAFGSGLAPEVANALAQFGPDEVIAWAESLGQDVFTGSTGRVFPKTMKASPLLRAWLRRLDENNVRLRTRLKWRGWDGEASQFEGPNGDVVIPADVTILALGGASWKRLGSDGAWSKTLDQVAPFQPANMGFDVKWSDHMVGHFGTPVKGVKLVAGNLASRGEIVVTKHGIEGGGIYEVSRAVRDGAPLTMDMRPDQTLDQLRRALKKPRGKASLSTHLRKTLKLVGVQLALLNEFGRPLPADIAALIKGLPIRHSGPRPIDEAISTSGGLRFEALDDGLMLRDRPGVFAAGEMLDWEAPTGGYLINGCLATGRAAAHGALAYLSQG